MFTAALLTKAKAWKQPKCPSTDERLRVWHAQTMEYYSAMKKNEIMPFAATWMDLEMSTWSKGRHRKTRIISLTCGVKLKKKIIQRNLSTEPEQTHRHRKHASRSSANCIPGRVQGGEATGTQAQT